MAATCSTISRNSAKKSWAQETLNFPRRRQGRSADITGSVPAKKEEAPKPAVAAPRNRQSPTASWSIPSQTAPVSASERAILERLQARRQELEARAREIDIRESLLKSAEKRIESKVEEMKAVEVADRDGDRAEERDRRRPLQGHHHDV